MEPCMNLQRQLDLYWAHRRENNDIDIDIEIEIEIDIDIEKPKEEDGVEKEEQQYAYTDGGHERNTRNRECALERVEKARVKHGSTGKPQLMPNGRLDPFNSHERHEPFDLSHCGYIWHDDALDPPTYWADCNPKNRDPRHTSNRKQQPMPDDNAMPLPPSLLEMKRLGWL
jgi:hypothetical protein